MQTSFFLRKITILGIFIFAQVAHTQSLPEVRDVDLQPLKAQVQRLVQAKDYLGEPFSSEVKKQLNQALGQVGDQLPFSRPLNRTVRVSNSRPVGLDKLPYKSGRRV